MDFEAFMERAFFCSVFSLVATLVCGIIYCLAMVIITPSTWTHCTIESSTTPAGTYYTVRANVEWGSDDHVGNAKTLKEAQQLAGANNCPVQ